MTRQVNEISNGFTDIATKDIGEAEKIMAA
jgi:hypothetical protein